LDLLELWAGRVAGALSEDDYTKKLAQTGFNQIGIETAWLYGLAGERAFLFGQGLLSTGLPRRWKASSSAPFVRATKPAKACRSARVL